MTAQIYEEPKGCLNCKHYNGPVDSLACEKCFSEEDDDKWPGFEALTTQPEVI